MSPENIDAMVNDAVEKMRPKMEQTSRQVAAERTSTLEARFREWHAELVRRKPVLAKGSVTFAPEGFLRAMQSSFTSAWRVECRILLGDKEAIRTADFSSWWATWTKDGIGRRSLAGNLTLSGLDLRAALRDAFFAGSNANYDHKSATMSRVFDV
jgi:hypothetical protein